MALIEPLPIWPDAPRYCPERAYPPYRFVPGVTPHPRRDPKGHAYGEEEESVDYLSPPQWRENKLYLYGIDLYHQAYFWEAHEYWEILWKCARNQPGDTSNEADFLQSLIQNSAAQLKRHLEQWPAMAHLGKESLQRIEKITERLAPETEFMGLNLPDLLDQMQAHYQPVKLEARPPLLKLR